MGERASSAAAARRPGAEVGVHDLVVELGGTRVLDGVDLEVGAGRVLAVLGPSGGGKTTLLRAVAGLVAPTTGRVEIDGADQAGVPSHRRGVGLMFQDHQLFPHRDVAGNVGFGLRMAGVGGRARRDRVAEVLELVGLPGIERRAVASLSGGEAQRVALARSLAPRPSVLLLDEPLGSVDRVLHDRLVEDLRSLVKDQGVTVVHVTHDRHEALGLADDLAVLAAGRVVQAGPAPDVWRAPRSELAARLLGSDTVVDAVVGEGGQVAIDGTVVGRAPQLSGGLCRVVLRAEALEVATTTEQASAWRAEGCPVLEAVVLRTTFAGASTDLVVGVGAVPSVGQLRASVRGARIVAGDVVAVRLLGDQLHALPATP